MKKTLISLTLAAAGFVALAAPASAHTPKVSHDCSSAGSTLTVHLTKYEKGSTVTVTGQVQGSGSKSEFGTADYKATFNLGAADKAHTWTVVVTNGSEYTPKTDKYDATYTDTVDACVTPPTTTAPLEDKDLTPPTTTYGPPKVEYVNPAWPICMVPGKHLFNAHDPECVDTPVVMAPPLVLDRQPAPVALAFTGSEATERGVMAGALLTIGLSCLLIGRRFGKVA
jgi:hypothetical protein